MSQKHPWWVHVIAKLTGRTATQVAWRLRQGDPLDDASEDRSGAKRAWDGASSLIRDSLPGWAGGAPATFFLSGIILVWYVLVIASTGHIAAFSTYTLNHWGATNGVLIGAGDWWRVISSNFTHHDLLHLAFNLYALSLAGRCVETLFGSGRMAVAFVVTGIAAMSVSHYYYTEIAGIFFVTSGGASGSVSGLIGMAVAGGHRAGTTQGKAIRDAMVRWTIYMALFGFFMSTGGGGGINNAAHGGGFVAGLALGWFVPLRGFRMPGVPAAILACVILVLFSYVQVVSNWNGRPAGFEEAPRFIFGKLVGGDREYYRDYGLNETFRRCETGLAEGKPVPRSVRIEKCEQAVAIEVAFAQGWLVLSDLYAAEGEDGKSERALEAADFIVKHMRSTGRL